MEYSNFYDLKSLIRLNEREGCACSIEERDVEKVNRLISRMRKEREENPAPVAGDTVTYTTRGGDYYPQAHIERSDGREAQLCLLPRMPFCHEKEGRTCYNTEGGPWVTTDPGLLLPDGIRGKQFRTWGHTGRHENGAVLFRTSVRAWKYTEPEPLYGEYTTKEWTKYLIERRPERNRLCRLKNRDRKHGRRTGKTDRRRFSSRNRQQPQPCRKTYHNSSLRNRYNMHSLPRQSNMERTEDRLTLILMRNNGVRCPPSSLCSHRSPYSSISPYKCRSSPYTEDNGSSRFRRNRRMSPYRPHRETTGTASTGRNRSRRKCTALTRMTNVTGNSSGRTLMPNILTFRKNTG